MSDIDMTRTRSVRRGDLLDSWNIDVDICVVGAGISGLSAAIEAARQNKKVLLLDSSHQLGGQTYNAVIGCFCGFFSNGSNGYQFTHGIADELFSELKAAGGLYENPVKNTRVPYYNETIFLRWAEKKIVETGVQVLLGAVLNKVDTEGRRINKIHVATRYGEVVISAEGFIDASGDAALAWFAGLPCNIPENGAVYGSEMFLLEGINFTESVPEENELMDKMEHTAGKYRLLRKKGLMFYCPQRGGIAIGNMTHVDTPLDPLEASMISIKGKDQVDNVVKFLKAEYPKNFSESNVRIYGQTGVRQTRWIHGVKQLSLKAVRSGERPHDAIARSAWPVELHNHGEGYIWEVFSEDHVHYIPLGSLLSPEADNYAACGRCIDADVAALSSVRVMGPCVATGAAAAHALVLSGKGSIHDIDIGLLQKRIAFNID